MQKRIEGNEFLEYATVHGNLYGTSYQSIQDVIASNRSCILDIDIQGVQSVMKKQAEGTYILIVPPSIEELRRRLYARNTDSEESIPAAAAQLRAGAPDRLLAPLFPHHRE